MTGKNMGFFSSIGKSISKGFKSLTKGFKSNPIGSILGMTGLPQSTSQFIPGGELLQSAGSLLGSGIQDFWGSYTGETIAKKNLEAQEKQWSLQNDLNERQFAYQQQLNAQQQQREDTAMQRKVADLKAAGMNPVLAAGGSGSPSTPLSAPAQKTAPAPYLDDYSKGGREALSQISSAVFQALSMKKDFAMKDAEISLLRANKEKADAEAAGVKIENDYKAEYLVGRNKSQALANAASEAKMPAEIKKIFNEVDLQEQEKVLRNLDAEAARLKISGYELDNIRKELDNKGALFGLSIKEQEIMINSLAIARKTLENKEYEYGIKFYHDRYFGMPYDGHSIPSAKVLAYMAVRQGLDVLDENLPPKKGVRYTRSEWKKAVKEATSYPKSANYLWNKRMVKEGDYGARSNH